MSEITLCLFTIGGLVMLAWYLSPFDINFTEKEED